METKWLEDFISLAETRSFSRSAALRHVTQPAFSRRIQALEAWLGAELIDRSGYPTRLTQAGNIFHAQALALLNQAREARTLLRGQGVLSATTLDFAVPHTLSLTFFPQWIQRIDALLARGVVTPSAPAADGKPPIPPPSGPLHARLRALNVHDAVLTLTEGGCDLIMGYHHPSHPVALDPRRYAQLTLGTETIGLFCAAGPPEVSASVASAGGARTGRLTPRFTLPGSPTHPVPYLAYASDAYLGRMTEVLLSRATQPLYLDRIYETDMAEGLKVMAVAGHGIAFLPHSAAADALADGRLVPLGDVPGNSNVAGPWTLTMEIRLYRDTLADVDGQRRALRDAVWEAAQRLLDHPEGV
ncbi:LysR family transcriptional regulator [Robbsia andropogonis]|uniref:LysR family transcriptional regulator n=1 Tax=Robbsia andropogonis TaxID=28092 RepID=A0A0F5K517_9BURK|nr:LysR family transcriptional regulator [Robbsia andropogonis]KKB65188.1 LysR family transcriptional regulator [Robbsia andropogonis]MCP1117063.1 LysR family transcriptional regulator [Robbsia andropogonis]MCP1128410.1 LysR family transcriptional regulator [Robbsia andropogonis]